MSASRESAPSTCSSVSLYASFELVINSVVPPAASTFLATYASKTRANISVGRVQYWPLSNCSTSDLYVEEGSFDLVLPSISFWRCEIKAWSFLVVLPVFASYASVFVICCSSCINFADVAAFSKNIAFIKSPIAFTIDVGAPFCQGRSPVSRFVRMRPVTPRPQSDPSLSTKW